MIEEFEYGIDHCGHGIAPLLVIGGPVYASNFEVRDLSTVQGVVIKERGVPKGLSWSDLNLRILGDQLKNLRFLDIEFSGKVSLDDFGKQPNLTKLYLNCPKMLAPSYPLFPALIDADILVPDAALRNLLVPSLEKLALERPHFRDLTILSENRALRSLNVSLARNLTSIDGLPDSLHMDTLVFSDCPQLTRVGPQKAMPGPTEMILGGCKRLDNLSGVELFSKLRKLSLVGHGPQVVISKALLAANIELEIRGRDITRQQETPH